MDRESFVKAELVSNKATESWLALQTRLKFAQALMVAGARERDVGVVGTGVKHETTGRRTGDDVPLHLDQGEGKLDAGKEYPARSKNPGASS